MENRIKEVLIEKGITQKELAKRVGMTEVGICKAINGSAKQSTIDKIADAIDVDSWELKNPPQRNVVCEGELHVADIHLPCYVLDDGERIISSRQMVLALRMVDDDRQQNMSGTRMARYLNQESLKPFIEKHLRDGNVETITCYKNGAKINGYLATDLVDICEMFLDARAHIKLSPRQKIIATQCEILVRAFAKVGIIALVDEATGYQYERERNELQKILTAYVSEEILKWQLTFTDEFYKQVYRLWGLPYIPKYIRTKPSFIGGITLKYIYEQLPVGVVDKIKQQTGKTEKGNWKFKWHQSLTPEIGRKHLIKQIHEVTTLMSISNTKEEFEYFFKKKYGKELELPFDFNDFAPTSYNRV